MEKPTSDLSVEEIWVTVTEGAEKTGYNLHAMRKMIWKMGAQPEEEREIQLRKRSYGWELWLPDLIGYIEEKPGRGPKGKRSDK
jgi:hypothetical protein